MTKSGRWSSSWTNGADAEHEESFIETVSLMPQVSIRFPQQSLVQQGAGPLEIKMELIKIICRKPFPVSWGGALWEVWDRALPLRT